MNKYDHFKYECLACRNEHMKKRTINPLKINQDALHWVADISVLYAMFI